MIINCSEHCIQLELNIGGDPSLPIAIPKISYCHVLLLGAFFPEIARITRLLSLPSAAAASTWDLNPFEFELYCIIHIVSHRIISNDINPHQMISNHIKS